MDQISIIGGKPLSGRVRVSGAKNAALKMMAASILTDDPLTLHGVPRITDVITMMAVLRELGVKVSEQGEALALHADGLANYEAPYQLVSQMRASIIVLGPLLARLGRARVAMPGGCNIGSRKIDMHITGLERLGARIEVGHGYIEAHADHLVGAHVRLAFPSVGATENLLMSACLARGTTVIENAAREPEIVDLADCLSAMGADISGAGTPTIVVHGVERLHGGDYRVIADRIEAGTLLAAAVATGGEVFVEGARADHLKLVLRKFEQMGTDVSVADDGIAVAGRPTTAINIATLPYPGFPTDLQAQFMVLLSLVEGMSIITENVFDKRFSFSQELERLGGKVSIDGHHAVIYGRRKLVGKTVKAPDLRAGAALVIAGLAAAGRTRVSDVHHIDRGYEDLIPKLQSLGADIRRQAATPVEPAASWDDTGAVSSAVDF